MWGILDRRDSIARSRFGGYTLARWFSWLEHPIHQKVVGWIPVRAHTCVVG